MSMVIVALDESSAKGLEAQESKWEELDSLEVSNQWLLLLEQGLTLSPEEKETLEKELTSQSPGIYSLRCDYQNAQRTEARVVHSSVLKDYLSHSWPILTENIPCLTPELSSASHLLTLSEEALLAGQEKEPENPLWSYHLGVHYFDQKQDAKAHKVFKNLITKEQNTFYVWHAKLYYLKLLWEMKQHEKTFEKLNHFFETTPQLEFYPAVWVLRGVIAKHFDQLSLAKECFQKAYDLHFSDEFKEENPWVLKADYSWKPLVGLGEVYLEESLFTQAFHSFSKALEYQKHPLIQTHYVKAGFFIKAFSHIEPYLKPESVFLTPAIIEGLKYLAGHALAADDVTLDLLNEVKIMQPEPFLLSVLIEVGVLLLKNGKTALAQGIFLKLTKVVPKEAMLWHNLGFSYFSQEDYSQAQENYQQAIEANPEYIPSLLDLGKVLVMQGNTLEAIEQFKRILFLEPQHAMAQQAIRQLESTFEQFTPTTDLIEPPAQTETMPFVFVFPLEPTWENGADIALKNYYEAFLPEDEVILAFPSSAPEDLLIEAQTWATEKYNEALLPPIMVLETPLPLVENKTCLYLPYRVAPAPEILDEIKAMPYARILPHDTVYQEQRLPVHWLTEKGEDARVWSEVEPKVLQSIMRLAAEGELNQENQEGVEFHTHHCLEMVNEVQIAPQRKDSDTASQEATKKPGLSVCMIVKNEIQFLAQCLDSVHDEVDEIIVVDTGSTDGTQALAEKYEKVKLFDFEWQDDFALARNFSLSKASQPWILSLDADEALPTGFISTLSHYLTQDISYYDALVFPVIAIDTAGQEIPNETLPVPRVFRNKPEYQFIGRIHEMLKHADRSKMNYLFLQQLPIHHKGYQPEVKAEKQKLERDITLMEAMINEEPDLVETTRLYRILAGQYVQSGDTKTALTWLEKGITKADHDPKIKETIELYRWELLLSQEEANTVVKEITHLDDPGVSHVFLLGQAFAQQGLLEQAISCWEKTLTRLDESAISPDPLNVKTQAVNVLEQLAQTAYQIGNTAKSVYYLKRLLKLVPNHTKAQALLQEFTQLTI